MTEKTGFPWFRLHNRLLHDPKVQSLPPALFKRWINLLCVASVYDGQLPVQPELNLVLNSRSDHLQRDIKELVSRGLIDEDSGILRPHNWQKYQYKSDFSRSRMKRHRDGASAVTPTVTVTAPDSDYRLRDSFSDSPSENPQRPQGVKNGKVTDLFGDAPPSKTGPPPGPKPGAHEPDLSDQRTQLYARGKDLLGTAGGALVTKLIKAKGDSVPHARSALESAATKADPKQFVMRVIKGAGVAIEAEDQLDEYGRAPGDRWYGYGDSSL